MNLLHVIPILTILLGGPRILMSADRAQGPAGSAAAVEVVLENGGTGPHPAIVTEKARLPGMTIYRPRDLSGFGGARTLPVLLWGNGACANTTYEHKNFLNELASHGYVVLGIGLLSQLEERGEPSRRPTSADQLLAALDCDADRSDPET